MGEEKIKGHLTTHEQIILGIALTELLPRGGEKDKKDGYSDLRREEYAVLSALGAKWVPLQKAKRQRAARAAKEEAFVPFTVEEYEDPTLHPFKISKSNLSWLMQQFDKIPSIGADDIYIAELEDYLLDLKAGAKDRRAPAPPPEPTEEQAA